MASNHRYEKDQDLNLLLVCTKDITNDANTIKNVNVIKKMIKKRKAEYKVGYFVINDTLG